MKLAGYAAIFDSYERIGGDFIEVIRRGAFRRTLADPHDILFFYAHDDQHILARRSNGTLRLKEDQIGLAFDAELPKTSLAKDVYELVKRGDIQGMSFGFWVSAATGERWSETKKGELLREMIDIDLFEVSLTSIPAYPDTTVAARWGRPQPTENHALLSRHFRLGQGRVIAVPDATPPPARRHQADLLERHRRLRPDGHTSRAGQRARSRLTQAEILARHRRLKPRAA